MVENGTLGEMDVPPAVKKLIWSRGYNPKTQPCIFVPKLTTIRGVEEANQRKKDVFDKVYKDIFLYSTKYCCFPLVDCGGGNKGDVDEEAKTNNNKKAKTNHAPFSTFV